MIDGIDREIIKQLKENAKLQWKEIGEKVHMTGQAVAARVRKLEEAGVIKRFTVEIDQSKLDSTVTAFVTVFMTGSDHHAFQRFARSRQEVLEMHRISGGGCYWLKVCTANHEGLNEFLDLLLKYGNYRISISIGEIG